MSRPPKLNKRNSFIRNSQPTSSRTSDKLPRIASNYEKIIDTNVSCTYPSYQQKLSTDSTTADLAEETNYVRHNYQRSSRVCNYRRVL